MIGIIKFFKVKVRQLLNLEDTLCAFKFYHYDVKHVPSKWTRDKIAKIRSKERIRVAFIIYDIAKWKSEALYLAMCNHDRFDPILVPILYNQTDYAQVYADFNRCIQTLDAKGYDYVVGSKNRSIDDLVNPDVVFYGEPYSHLYDAGYTIDYDTKRDSLGCYVPYCFRNTNIKSTSDKPQMNILWQIFFENQSVVDDLKLVMTNGAVNHIATGLPIQDSYEKSLKAPEDVWKKQACPKKRIIWAPSYSIPNSSWNVYEQSTFLEMAEKMILLAQKYKDQVQIAFKPHPLLRPRLNVVWGRHHTDAYFDKWASMDNSQLEEGQYVDLFMSSDAMIHDCMSFMVEYMYSEKPIMFLDNGSDTMSICNTQTKESYALHYKGSSVEDVECFIESVILGGNDYLRPQRLAFKQKYLVPPYGKSASQNIINAILGVEEFSER